MLSKFISIRVFIVSLAVGIFFVYLSTPDPTIIYVYPTPDNVKSVEYKDHAGTCFQYQYQEVNCSAFKNVKTIPVQSDLKTESQLSIPS